MPVFVCVCAPMSCLLFAGDSPSSLAAIQDLFSPSLYITANGITDALCPVLSFPPPPPPFVSLPLPVLSPPLSSTLLCVGDVTARHSLVLLYHPWDREVTGPEHTI